jgi:hypothetical protein
MLLGATLVLACVTGSASAVSLAGKDGRIHACYKVKGKAKGTLRVVRGAKARCPRGWKKTAWNAGGQFGAAGEQGSSGGPGSPGEAGGKGESGAQGTAGKVSSLESKVSELLTKLKSLESILAGVTNPNLKEAIGTVPAVTALCGQASQLNSQTASLGSAMGALNTVLAVTFPLLDLPAVPVALPAFSCP